MLPVVQLLFVFAAILIVLVVLIQKGKGGGLSGAFGGVGGQTAFGTRTADVMTKFTMGLAIVWILLAMVLVVWMKPQQVGIFEAAPGGGQPPAEQGQEGPAQDAPAPAENEGGGSSRRPDAVRQATQVLARVWDRPGVNGFRTG